MIRKHCFPLLAALTLTLALTGCGGGGGGETPFDPADTAQTLLDSGCFSEPLEALDADLIAGVYGLEQEPKEAAVYASTGATAEEVVVVVYDSAGDAEAARTALEQRVADQKDACEGYLPAELPKLDKAILAQRGGSVLLVVAADADKAQAALDGLK